MTAFLHVSCEIPDDFASRNGKVQLTASVFSTCATVELIIHRPLNIDRSLNEQRVGCLSALAHCTPCAAAHPASILRPHKSYTY